jgi:hypothetical protein
MMEGGGVGVFRQGDQFPGRDDTQSSQGEAKERVLQAEALHIQRP